MQQELNDIELLLGNREWLEELEKVPSLSPFSEEVLAFFSELSLAIREDREAGQYSDIQTYGFWFRKGNLQRLQRNYTDLPQRIGRGLTFHIAPSNIPLMFLFSISVSLLSGNPNIARISSRDFPQTKILIRLMEQLLSSGHSLLRRYICILRYPHAEEITSKLSTMCATRIIWGGNRAIGEIRKSALPPWAVDLPFYDRFSLCIIESEQYLLMEDREKTSIAEKFYNDTYFTDQNACSSPRLMVWLGPDVAQARKIFWEKLLPVVEKKYEFQPIQAVDKLAAACRLAIGEGQMRFHQDTMKLCRAELLQLPDSLMDYRCPGGYFFEYHAERLSELASICSRECQTIAHVGLESQEILDAVKVHAFQGVDRIVPVGSTMEFGLQWDGFDFVYSLTKIRS